VQTTVTGIGERGQTSKIGMYSGALGRDIPEVDIGELVSSLGLENPLATEPAAIVSSPSLRLSRVPTAATARKQRTLVVAAL
jgi:hypothetical protein